MHPAEHGNYVTLSARLSQWDFNYGPAIDGSTQTSDFQKDNRRQMNKQGIAFIVVDIKAVVSKTSDTSPCSELLNSHPCRKRRDCDTAISPLFCRDLLL
jgi:hypothetical protein